MAALIEKLLIRWNQLILKNSIAVLILIPLLAVLSLYYTVNNLGMNTDTTDMLSQDLQWRQLDIEYEQSFDHTTDNLILVVEAATADEAMDAATRLEKFLQDNKSRFKSIHYTPGLAFIRESSLLYMDMDELQKVSDTLARNQAFLGYLLNDQSLPGLFEMLNEAIKARDEGEETDIDPVLEEINQALIAVSAGQHYRLSWQKLLMGETDSKTVYREFITVQPVMDYASLLPAEEIIADIKQWAKQLNITEEYHQSLKLTGSVALSHEEMLAVSEANIKAIIIALVLVAIVMTFGIGSIKLVGSILISLLIGLVLTAGFATITVGELNLISVAFAVLYIGLGVDFAIHYCLRYRELKLEDNISSSSALDHTSSTIGASLLICAITTAIGFYSFMPTDYDGVAELGWISGSGMFISLIITLSFLPALLKHISLEPSNKVLQKENKWSKKFLAIPQTAYRVIICIAIILCCLSIWLSQDVYFDNNTLNLQPTDNEAIKTFKELLEDDDISPLRNVVLANSREQALEMKQALEALPVVDKVIWLESFVPENQDEKLPVIDDMYLLQGGLFAESGRKEHPIEDKLSSLQTVSESIANSQIRTAITEQFKTTLDVFISNLADYDKTQKDVLLNNLEDALLISLKGRLDLLEASLETEGLVLEDLPESFTSRWLKNNKYLLEILPTKNLKDNDSLNEYVASTQSAVPTVIGSPVVSVEAGNAVVKAFIEAFSYAFMSITILLLFLMPGKSDSLYVLIPLLLAALMTAAISVLISMPLNFANIIALPLLFGIGVDSAIHLIHRSYNANKDDVLLANSSARGILISTLTTVLSIGNLAFSPHVGTASMGLLLAIGIIMALICTLILIPALLTTRINCATN